MSTTAPEEPLLTRIEDGVAIAVLNRPDRRNALSAEMVAALARTLAEWESDPHVGAVVVTGAGPAFCAGGDVKAFAARGGEAGGASVEPAERIRRQQVNQRDTVGRLHGMEKPTIAALPGPAAGAGLGLALACDFRIACERSTLVPAFASVGLSGDYGVAWLLSQLAGPALARRLMLLGERLSADEAERFGLVDQIVPAEDVLDTAVRLGRRLADGPRTALGLIKANLVDAQRLELDAAMEAEVVRHQLCGATDDHREAVRAFVDKRAPRFGAVKEGRER